MKIAICAIAKNEELYLDEWINYHLSIGVDHIFVNDNNDLTHDMLKIDNSSVTVIDVRGKKYYQNTAYSTCFKKYKSDFDWFIFIDVDEFIYVDKKYKDIKEFIKSLSKNKIIRLNWKHYTDSDILDVKDSYSVMSRFLESKPNKKDIFGKSIISSSIESNNITCHGCFDYDAVDCEGHKCLNDSCVINKKPVYTNAWINHYHTKTIGEYIRQKYFRGDATSSKFDGKYNLDHFFEYNTYSDDKLKYGLKLISEIQNEHNKVSQA